MRRSDQEERRRLFRMMEWVFVIAPPALAIFIAGFGAAFVAWLIPVPGTSFWARWGILVALILGMPLLWLGIRSYLANRR
jgi:hypothetical protein